MSLQIKIVQLNQFYERWIEKSNAYVGDDLNSAFDKFFTQFVIFNRLYNVVVAILDENDELDTLRNSGKIHKRKKIPYENQIAIFCVAHYLRETSNEIITELEYQINIFKDIIRNNRFNIDLYYGKPQPNKDKEILTDLESNTSIQQLEGILKILYNIRCNIFHGEKGYNHNQTRVLLPCNSSLEHLNNELHEKVNH